MAITACTNCSGKRLYKSRKEISAGGGYAPNYLPGLGTLLKAGKFQVIVCVDCGLTRFFASPEARAKLSASPKWERV